MLRVFSLLLSCALLTACGLKGPLYLPDRSTPAAVTSTPSDTEASPTPASEPPSNTEEGEEDAKAKQAK